MKIIVPKRACPFNNMDGEMRDIEQYEVLNASSDRINSSLMEDPDLADLYSDASGLRAAINRGRKKRAKRRSEINKRRNLRTSSKAKARTQRTGAKVEQARAQRAIAKSSGGSDAALLAQLNTPDPGAKKVNIGLYVGIGAGVLVLTALAIYAMKQSSTPAKAA